MNDVPQWYAVRVRSNLERTCSARLHDKGFEQYVPLYRSRRKWSDRFKEIVAPLFPGYVFCRFAVATRASVLAIPGVVSIVSFGRKPVPIPDEEIAAIETVLQSQLTVQAWPFVKVGHRVLVNAGPLAGVEGIVLCVRNQLRLVVSVSLLQRSVSVELDRSWVESAA